MATPAQFIEQQFAQHQQNEAARKQELQDEQRKVTLKTLQEDAETPADKVAAIQAVYHKDPGVLKQHVENLTRRLTGQPTQPVVAPQQAQQARLAPIAARGKTPEQQALDQSQAQGQQKLSLEQQQAQQKQKQTFDLIDQYVTDSEQNKTLKEDYVRKQAGATAQFKNLPGAAGQPYKTPNGQWVRPVQSADGSIVEQPLPAGYTGPQAKPAKPLYKVIRNHAVLIDPNTGQVTHDLGLATEARTTTRQAIQTDADGVPHIVSLTSVSTPGGGSVDVDMAPEAGGATPTSKGPAPKKPTGGGSGDAGAASPAPKGPAPRAQSNGDKTLDFRKATPQSNAAKKAVDTAQNSYLDVQKAGANGALDPVGSQGVVLSWLRGRVNRVTNNEITAVRNLGGIFDKFDGNVSSLTQGTMTPKQYQWFLRSAKDNYDNAQQVAGKYNSPASKGTAAATGDKSVDDFLKNF